MIDELRARFRSRFIDSARARISRTREGSDLASIAHELHSLAGEAAVLEFSECARLARTGEQLARSGDAVRCREVVDALERAVDLVAG